MGIAHSLVDSHSHWYEKEKECKVIAPACNSEGRLFLGSQVGHTKSQFDCELPANSQTGFVNYYISLLLSYLGPYTA